jgi:hypothetical protein
MRLMSRVLDDLSTPALVAAIEGNGYALFDAFAALPGAAYDVAPELTRFCTPHLSPMFNGVMRTRLTSESADAAIAATIDAFREAGTRLFFWWTGPATTPSDLGERLVAQGFLPFDVDAAGMAIDLHAVNQDLPVATDLEIETVRDATTLGTWAETFCAAYEVPAFAGESWIEATSALGIERAPWRLYLGRLQGEPIATSMLMPFGGVAGLTGIAVKTAARRRGVGAAMTLAPLRDGRELGFRVGALWATELGTPLYERLGFRSYCTISRFLWRAPD